MPKRQREPEEGAEEEQPPHPLIKYAYEAVQCRRWTWTMWDEPHDDSALFSYIAFQMERCPTTGSLHFQGYVETKTKRNRAAVMTALWGPLKGKHFWCTPSKGTAAQNKEYCSKLESREGDFYERGVPQQQGKAAGLHELSLSVLATGGRIPRVTEENAGAMAFHLPKLIGLGRLIREQLEADAPAGRRDVIVTLHVGPSGTGKSHYGGKYTPGVHTVVPSGDKPNWNGYAGQTELLIDDVPARWTWNTADIKNILEGGTFAMDVKWDTMKPKWTAVHITTNHPPDKWVKDPLDWGAIDRRIHNIYRYDAPYTQPTIVRGAWSSFLEARSKKY